ncbi:DMT family transporter [Mesobacillus maritimus]|uniref:DMT family transporter n=1 Tax=Mesobacillus maritimus TaxID=1643336 RepID=UPI00203D83BE|nr:DMT family transporter [Mesobacillus maritimus]
MIYSYLLMVLVVIFYAGNILVGKAINDLPPFTIAFFRVLISFIILIPIGMKAAWKHRLTLWEHKRPLLIMTLTGVTFFNTFIYGALQFTTATNVSILETVIPVVTVIFSVYLLKERLVPLQWLGILLSFLGAIWVVMDGKIFAVGSIAWNIGDGIMVGAILTWAIYSIYVKKYMHLFPTSAFFFIVMGISVIVLFPIVLLEWTITGVPSFDGLNHFISLSYLGIFPSLIALAFYNRAVDLLGPSQASIFLNFLPVITMFGAYLWFDETITLMKIIGTLIVISGVIITTQFSGKRRVMDNKVPQSQSF